MLDEKAALDPNRTPEEAIDAFLTTCLVWAQKEFERKTQTRLFETRIVSNPPPAGQERGIDYDVIETPYNFVSRDWRRGRSGTITLRNRPIREISFMGVRYGQATAQSVIQFPKGWINPRSARGIVELLPVVGAANISAGALVMLPILNMSARQSNILSMVLSINYTAGFLPTDFDAENDSLADACPDYDAYGVVEAISKLAMVRVFDSLSMQSDSESGGISMGGLSENVSAGRYQTILQTQKADAAALIDEIKTHFSPPPIMMM